MRVDAFDALLPEEDREERLARERADLDARFSDPASRPALFGVQVAVKDIFHVDGFETRAGSRLPPGVLAGAEGPAVAALRAAGALVLGKAVSTEFAYFAPGPTRNPRNPEHTPGGSSSGSAAAVAAGLCPLALGTQTIGSVIRPAAFCGVVGFKPSYDRISREGLIALAPSFDHVGVFAPVVAWVARAAAVLCAGWRSPEQRLGRKEKEFLRLGIPAGPYLETASEEGLAHFRATAERLGRAGFEIVSVPMFADFAEIAARHRRVVAAEIARVHVDWFPRFGHLYDARTVELIERGLKISDAELAADLAACSTLRGEIDTARERADIDFWISPPALGAAPRGLGSTGDPVMNIPWSQAGVPAITLPAGVNAHGLPMGLQISGTFGDDEALLSVAATIEESLEKYRVAERSL